MLVAAGLALALSVLAVSAGDAAPTLAILPWGVLAVVATADALVSFARGRALTVDIAPEMFVGETSDLTLRVARAPHLLKARPFWPEGLSGPDEIAFTPAADGTATAVVPCRAVRRGLWRLEALWLSWPSRLALFQFVPRLRLESEVRVVPNIRPVQSGQITTTVMSALYGVKENRAIGEGSEFHQLRDFVRGMDVKAIDWKRSARKRVLVAKELRAERNHHVVIVLDNGYLMRQEVAGLPRIDHATTAALAVAWAAAISGDLVGYYAYDAVPRQFIAPTPGRAAFARLRSWTADLAYVGRETNHTLGLSALNARTPKRSLIIVFTDFVDTTSAELLIENVRNLSRRHLAIFVTIRDPDLEAMLDHAPQDLDGAAALVAANQSMRERRLVFERLHRLGVTIVDALPNAVTGRLVSTYLEIKARDMI